MSKNEKLGKYLNEIFRKYGKKLSSKDPVWNLHDLTEERDIEIAALFVSCFSYGKVEQINSFVRRFAGRIGNDWHEFTLNFSEQKDKKYFEDLYHRFNTPNDLSRLIRSVNSALNSHGSLKHLFLSGLKDDDVNIVNALDSFSSGLCGFDAPERFRYLLPQTSKGSACKRLNLFMRWMVRKDEIDTGCWAEVGTRRLVMPVDTHVYNVSRSLGLVDRKSCDMKFAVMLTDTLKMFDPDDPVKYDFALCHIRMDKLF